MIRWDNILEGAATYGTLAYAARTIPDVSNRWIKWVIGIIQYILSNADKGKAALSDSKSA